MLCWTRRIERFDNYLWRINASADPATKSSCFAFYVVFLSHSGKVLRNTGDQSTRGGSNLSDCGTLLLCSKGDYGPRVRSEMVECPVYLPRGDIHRWNLHHTVALSNHVHRTDDVYSNIWRRGWGVKCHLNHTYVKQCWRQIMASRICFLDICYFNYDRPWLALCR